MTYSYNQHSPSPDDVLLEVFAFCLRDPCWNSIERRTRVWQRLVHVCQRWRRIIYASPFYLDLQLHCSNRTPFRKNLRLLSRWPAFPISISYGIYSQWDHHRPRGGDNRDAEVFAALELPGRVRRIDVETVISGMEEVIAMMQVPFPVLTHLELSGDSNVPVLHGGFLGGAAPCLQHLRLKGIPFPELPSLLLSTRDLVSFQLNCIPPTGYISPEAMVIGLAGLTRLRNLCIETQSPVPPPERTRRPDPPVLALLPALTQCVFVGDREYLEDLVAQIDMPRVEGIRIEYSTQEFQTPQLSQFIGGIAMPNLELVQFRRAQVTFYNGNVRVELDRPQGGCRQARLSVTTLGRGLDFRIPYVVHDTMLSNVDHLSVCWTQVEFDHQYDMDGTEWLPLLQRFPAVETMHVNRAMARHIASTLENIAEMAAEVLPALHLLCLEDVGDDDDDLFNYDAIEYSEFVDDIHFEDFERIGSTKRFISSRELSGRPVTIVNDQYEFVERLNAPRKSRSGCPFTVR
ncbi:hypothetical protein EDB85DRAFT_1484418 [Lactarius pseudohatsudake]|nr:hypothetical protein EDB85DRAFT_1484418 [Lactarius pseudohatsudake]